MARMALTTARAPSMATLAVLESCLHGLRSTPTPPTRIVGLVTRRHASHKTQGQANGAKDGPGKRLGAKKTGGAYVVPGNILFRQRGTDWFPGENCFMGRDHTIHAGQPGYVRYYRDPLKHPKRQYIGIVFEKDQMLPYAPNAPRRRKLGMLAFQTPSTQVVQESGDLGFGESPTMIHDQPQEDRAVKAVKKRSDKAVARVPTLRPGYQYRIGNWEIGREAERTGTAKSAAKRSHWIARQRQIERKKTGGKRVVAGKGAKVKGRK